MELVHLQEARDAAIAAYQSCEAYQFNLCIVWRGGRPRKNIDDLSAYVESEFKSIWRVRDRLLKALTSEVQLEIETATVAELPPITVYCETTATAHEAAIHAVNTFICESIAEAPTLDKLVAQVCEGVRAIEMLNTGELVARVKKEWGLATNSNTN